MEQTDVLIVDDHNLFREGLKILLKRYEDIRTIYEAANGIEALEIFQRYQPGIVLMDINMPEKDGSYTTFEIIKMFPDARIIALSMYDDEEYYSRMIQSGVRGFLFKDSSIDEVITAIRLVVSGKTYFSQEMLCNLVKQDYTTKLLTRREMEILKYICKGFSNKEIAELLCLSKRTIDKHRENILDKTNSKNTANLIMYAVRNKLID
ncbi:MAG: response regulator transcription factor [Marinilabiliales bacterium]